MTQEAKNIALGLGVVVVLFIASCELRAQSTPRYYDSQLLNYRFTEICSTPLPKGDALPNALNEAMKQDAKTWLPWVLWWNRIHAKYKEAGCGDA